GPRVVARQAGPHHVHTYAQGLRPARRLALPRSGNRLHRGDAESTAPRRERKPNLGERSERHPSLTKRNYPVGASLLANRPLANAGPGSSTKPEATKNQSPHPSGERARVRDSTTRQHQGRPNPDLLKSTGTQGTTALPQQNIRFCVQTKSHQILPTGRAGPQSAETAMLSWDEFDEEETTTAPRAATPAAAAQPAPQTATKLDHQAAGSVEEARAVAADDSSAVARAKQALNELDIQEGLAELEGESARV